MSSAPKMPSTFTYEKRGKIAIMTINRPDALNAFTAEMLRAMDAAFADFNDDDDLWVAILTGTGEKSFSSGMDLSPATRWATRITPSDHSATSSSRSSRR
jgi:enoyl-CoA hydratase/carnithine racemase